MVASHADFAAGLGAFPAPAARQFYTIVIGGLAIAMAGRGPALAIVEKMSGAPGCSKAVAGRFFIIMLAMGKERI